MSRIFASLFLAAALVCSMPMFAHADEADDVTTKVEKLLPAAPKAALPKGETKTTITTVTTTTRCAEVGAMDRMLMKERKLAFLATSIDKAQAVHIYFISHQTGNWVEMVMDNNLQACIVNEGTDWNFAAGN